MASSNFFISDVAKARRTSSFPRAAICFYQWFPWDVNSHLPSTLRPRFSFLRVFSSSLLLFLLHPVSGRHRGLPQFSREWRRETRLESLFPSWDGGSRVRVTARVSHAPVAPIMIILFFLVSLFSRFAFIIYVCTPSSIYLYSFNAFYLIAFARNVFLFRNCKWVNYSSFN